MMILRTPVYIHIFQVDMAYLGKSYVFSFEFPQRKESLFHFVRIEKSLNLGKQGIISGSPKLQFL